MMSMAEVEGLYRSYAAYLARVVRLDTRASEEVIEDACQHAWSSVVAHRERVDQPSAFAWLACTARHEAWRLAQRREAWAWPIDVAVISGSRPDAPGLRSGSEARSCSPAVMAAPVRTPPELVELRDEIRALGSLPERQQRLLWLHAAGLTYAEIARHEDISLRTVERQLLRGKRAARALAGLGGAGSARVAAEAA